MPYDITIGRNQADKESFGKLGLTYIGKGFVKMGQYTSLSNKIFMDIAKSHVILVAGKRGSGKSYTLGVLAEELTNLPGIASDNIASLIFDTMGIYWTMKYQNEKDKNLLKEWDLKPKNLPLKVFVPAGHFDSYQEKGIPIDEKFALTASELSAEDWIITFGLNLNDPISVLIQRSINKLSNKDFYNLNELTELMDSDKRSDKQTINAGIALFEAADSWGIFAKTKDDETKITDLTTPKTTTILDLSSFNSVGAFNIRALVISLVSRKLFNQRMISRKAEEIAAVSHGLDYSFTDSKKSPLVWMFIDEAHEFLPLNSKTIATDALVQILREGRQPGISLVLATQQPGQIHRDVMTQSDIVIAHRVTSKPDLEALNHIMQSYMLDSIKKQMDNLPSLKGSALILDDNSERIYPARIRPRFTWHGGEAPSAIPKEKRL